MKRTVDELAKTIFNYMYMNNMPVKSDIIIAMGSSDRRVAERAADLFLDGYGEHLVLTGGYGKVTEKINRITEAKVFQEVALGRGVPSGRILLESKATNSGENILLVEELLKEQGLTADSLLIVTKCYMERRAYAAYKKCLPHKSISITSPQLSYEDQWNKDVPKDLFINLMVGDLQRVRDYPKKGYQIYQDIPPDVWQAYEALVNQGFDRFIAKN